jgi:hypothetical protein
VPDTIDGIEGTITLVVGGTLGAKVSIRLPMRCLNLISFVSIHTLGWRLTAASKALLKA